MYTERDLIIYLSSPPLASSCSSPFGPC